MREFFFEARISNEDVTRDEAIAYATHHFDQQDGVVIDRYEETYDFGLGHTTSIYISGRALRRPE